MHGTRLTGLLKRGIGGHSVIMASNRDRTMSYRGESFGVYVIQRGMEFWTGTRFALAPYSAKLFPFEGDARDVIIARHLADRDNDKVTVVRCTITIGTGE